MLRLLQPGSSLTINNYFASDTCIRHVQINTCVDANALALFEVLSKLSRLTSLSLQTDEIISLADKLNQSAIASRIQLLDIQASKRSLGFHSLELCLPNLLELRLNALKGRQTPCTPFLEVEVSAVRFCYPPRLESHLRLQRELGKAVQGCMNLRFISFHYALDDPSTLSTMINSHDSSVEHLNPSEGYSRHYSECPLCLPFYELSESIRRELEATRILAQTLPRLQNVAWTNALMPPEVLVAGDESCQQVVSISRQTAESGMNIVLRREGMQTVRGD